MELSKQRNGVLEYECWCKKANGYSLAEKMGAVIDGAS